MRAPYATGDSLAWIDPDPDGIRLYRATVLHIEEAPERDAWSLTTDRGEATVDQTGNSGHVLPIDIDIAADLYLRGDGYLITSTTSDHHQELGLDGHEIEYSSDLGDDLDID